MTSVGPQWDTFALDNGAPDAVGACVTGRCLWDLIEGDAPRRALRDLLRTARSRVVRLPFRCDGPGVLRWMHFEARPARGGAVDVITSLLRRAPAPPGPPLPDPARLCAWCGEVEVAAGAWRHVNAVFARVAAGAGGVLHDFCPPCRARLGAACGRP